MLLRMLRRPRAGRPSPLARVVAALVVVGMVGLAAPTLSVPVFAVVRWIGAVLL